MLQKAIVQEYYRRNVGFFLVVLLFAFGFLRKIEHIAIAQYVLQSYFLMGMVFGLWTLYSLKTIAFVRRQFGHPAYQFLYQLRLFPARVRWFQLAFMQANLLIPIMAYSVFMLYLGVGLQTWASNILIICFLVFLTLAPLWLYERMLRHPNPEQTIGKIRNYFNQRITWPYPTFFIRYLLQHQAVLLALTKGFSCLILLGVLLLYPTDDYDERLLSLGMLFATIAHVILVYQHYEFEHQQLPLLRNLPILLSKRFVQYLLIYSLLLFPEVIILLRNWPESVKYVFLLRLVIFGIGNLLLIHNILFVKHLKQDKLTERAFWGVIIGFFLVMFRLDVGVIALLSLMTSVVIFKRFFYRSAYVIEKG